MNANRARKTIHILFLISILKFSPDIIPHSTIVDNAEKSAIPEPSSFSAIGVSDENIFVTNRQMMKKMFKTFIPA